MLKNKITMGQMIPRIMNILSKYDNIKAATDELSSYLDTFDTTPIEVTNYLKGIVQQEALQAWMDNNYRGIILMATGTGKSKIVVDWINLSNQTSSISYNSIVHNNLIVVPTEQLRDVTWKDEFTKWNSLDLFESKVETLCYRSLDNMQNKVYDTIILDEGQNITELNSSFALNNKYDKIMVLTATMPNDAIKRKLLKSIPVVYELPLDIAVKLRLVSPYEVIIVETELDKVNVNVNGGTKKKPELMTEYAAYQKINANVNKMMYGGNKLVLKMMMIKRMRLVYDLPSKLAAAQWIKEQFINERLLMFCGSIEHANRMSVWAYHSKSNDVALQKFMTGEINELSCVNALNEGININGVDVALLLQVNSNELHTIQRIGRCIRMKEGHRAKIIILCCNGTKDISWVTKATESLNKDNFRRVKFEDLINGIEKL